MDTNPLQPAAPPPLRTPPQSIAMGLPQGIKHDQGKDPWHLFPWDAARGVVKVLGFGASKYASRNWELGMDWERVYRAAINHLTKWWLKVDDGKGPGVDADTGYSHLWHAGCCVFFLIAYELRGVGVDSRPSIPTHPSLKE